MKILVTGGIGYIGLSLVERLIQRSDVSQVLVYDNLSKNNFNFFFDPVIRSSKLKFMEGDILDNHRFQDALEGCDWVYHLASVLPNSRTSQNLHSFDQVNNWGTAQVVDAVERSDVKGLVYTSSTEVYGKSAEPAAESKTPHPATQYGKSKLNAEQHVARLSGKMDVYRMRVGKVYGYNSCFYAESVINRMLFSAHHYNQIIIDGDGSHVLGFSYLQSVASSLDAILSDTFPPNVYNLVTANFSVLQIADVIERLYPELETRFVSQDMTLESIPVLPNERVLVVPSDSLVDLESHLIEMKNRFSVLGN
ncbi:NAD(P)-dependent oxidoreductase [Opitutales bacterium]|nr:NAD(P)-dependent oxidoreductase [Opitutales bacterium]MDB2681513.1 NAD(P)-dependent oxidoreductase [Opitutales bacterium]